VQFKRVLVLSGELGSAQPSATPLAG